MSQAVQNPGHQDEEGLLGAVCEELTLLEEIAQRFYLPPVAEGDFTLMDLVRRLKRDREPCQKIIDELLANGEIEGYTALYKGQTVTAYRRKPSDSG